MRMRRPPFPPTVPWHRPRRRPPSAARRNQRPPAAPLPPGRPPLPAAPCVRIHPLLHATTESGQRPLLLLLVLQDPELALQGVGLQEPGLPGPRRLLPRHWRQAPPVTGTGWRWCPRRYCRTRSSC